MKTPHAPATPNTFRTTTETNATMNDPDEQLIPTDRQRAAGCVVGAAVGDALGAPFEFRPAGQYRLRFPEPVLGGAGEMIGGGSFAWAPGEFTDDTQMGMALAHALLEVNGWDPDVVWEWFRAWAHTAADIGITTATALGHNDWRDVPRESERGAGNGALMRAFPLAVKFLRHDIDTVRTVTLQQGALTHPDPAAGWGAWILVEMCRVAICGGDPFTALDGIVASLPEDQHARFSALLQADWTPDQPHVTNGSVWGCLAEAVWAVRSTSNFHDAVVAAVNLGDDTDTVACVAGALAGSIYGVQAIPSRWTTYVNGRLDTPDGKELRMRNSDLLALTRRLLGDGEPGEEPFERAAAPREVAPGLYASNFPGASRVPNDWAVVSLCRVGETFRDHPVRRQVYLIDREGDHNAQLRVAVNDAVDAVDAFLTEGRKVVVHCHGGRSRTGLVLKAWKMRAEELNEREAHDWLTELWPLYDDYNRTFVEFLRDEWPGASKR